MKITLCDQKDCISCLSCYNSCPKNAISLVKDEKKKTIPIIDEEQCVACGACRKHCPVINHVEHSLPKAAYAAWMKDETERLLSSSGGVSYAMAQYVLENGGIVYGCVSRERVARHVRIDSMEDLGAIRGSKYVESFIGTTYKDAKRDLTDGKTVIFFGTPCQIAGLKRFLDKDYDNLIAVDLICHGTPPMEYLAEHIDAVAGKKWDHFSFRGKYDYCLTVYDESDGCLYKKYRDEDEYFKAFLDGMIFRDVCYTCEYSRRERVGDITIGDFWGLDRASLKEQYDGRVSVVLAVSERGKDFIGKLGDRLVLEERLLSEAVNEYQTNQIHPSDRHPDRDKFETAYAGSGFDKAVRKTSIGKGLRIKRLKKFVKSMIGR